MESLGYVLVYLLLGKLPWQNLPAEEVREFSQWSIDSGFVVLLILCQLGFLITFVFCLLNFLHLAERDEEAEAAENCRDEAEPTSGGAMRWTPRQASVTLFSPAFP